jgi:uncharacterized protein (DUF885 family)
MKKQLSLFVLTFITCIAFAQSKEIKANEKFDQFKEKFILAHWKQNPGSASSNGFHKYDSVLVIPSDEARKNDIAFCKFYEEELKKIDIKFLSENNKIDHKMMLAELASTQWYVNEYRSFEWNPARYNVCGAFAEMLANDYAPINERLRNFYLKMKNVNAYYKAAEQYLKNPTVEHTNLAVEQNTGGLSTFSSDLEAALKKCTLSEKEQKNITSRAKEVTQSILNFISFLKRFENKTPRSFRLGKDLYSKKFEHDIQSSYSAKEIYEQAVMHKKELHEKMYNITKTLWATYLQDKKMPQDKLEAIKLMIDVLSTKHTSAEAFQSEIEKQIPTLTSFIKEKNLLYLDPEKPLVVRKEPAYMAGVAGASISAPGPYDKTGNTYYNVGSFSGWDKDRIESYLREYNDYILQILNIHEALPGHYAQLVYSNKSPSIIKSIFGNGAMVEGWAVYAELMMLENGYGKESGSKLVKSGEPTTEVAQVAFIGENTNLNGEVTAIENQVKEESSPEMWLMYSKWNLRSTCNTILDYDVHVNDLSKEDAIKFLTTEAFQQQAEATGKWKRVSVSQVQLTSYFTGFTEIYNLREALKKKLGTAFSLKKFNEQFLSYGSAPVKNISELMLK